MLGISGVEFTAVSWEGEGRGEGEEKARGTENAVYGLDGDFLCSITVKWRLLSSVVDRRICNRTESG